MVVELVPTFILEILVLASPSVVKILFLGAGLGLDLWLGDLEILCILLEFLLPLRFVAHVGVIVPHVVISSWCLVALISFEGVDTGAFELHVGGGKTEGRSIIRSELLMLLLVIDINFLLLIDVESQALLRFGVLVLSRCGLGVFGLVSHSIWIIKIT